MEFPRRSFLTLTGATVVAGLLKAEHTRRFDAVAFDAFTLFDPRPVASLAEDLFPGRGKALTDLWRSRQFEYAWLRTLTGSYTGFEEVTENALVYAAKALSLELPTDRRDRLMLGFRRLTAWSDTREQLERLKSAGLRLALLSNFPETILSTGARESGFAHLMEQPLSTDRVRAYKPDPHAYRMAEDAMRVPRERILFAAFAGWDAAGAKRYGLPTFWVNRMGAPVEELGVAPDGVGSGLANLVEFTLESSQVMHQVLRRLSNAPR